ncbi:MAG: hydroxymethylglutaryl-CoA lyase [Bacillota bacterium]
MSLKKIKIVDVTLRDGLQNIDTFISTESKLKIVNKLINSGVNKLEITSFVNPKAVPQFKDAENFYESCTKLYPNISFSALTPNLKGVERAVNAGLKEIVFVLSASEKHNKSNVKMTVAESLIQLKTVSDLLKKYPEVNIQVDLSTAFGYEEDIVSVDKVIEISKKISDTGVNKIMYCDTSGIAVPAQVENLIKNIKRKNLNFKFGFHFHDTFGCAIANIIKAIELDCNLFEAAAGGLGGCPFAHGATGNVSLEDLVWVLDKMNLISDIDLNKLLETTQFLEKTLAGLAPINSKVYANTHHSCPTTG